MPITTTTGKTGRTARHTTSQYSATASSQVENSPDTFNGTAPHESEASGPLASTHREHTVSSGEVSNAWFAMVHTPLPIKKAMQIPAAKAALEKEWSKLEGKNAWGMNCLLYTSDAADE